MSDWEDGDHEALRLVVRESVRQYHGQLARRYAGPVVGLVVLLLVVTLVPSHSSRTGQQATSVEGVGQPTVGGTASGDEFTASGSTASAPEGGSTGGTGPGGGASGRGGSASAASRQASATTASAGSTASGVAKSGVTCGPGVRQVPWSKYAAACVAKFVGNNGGATSQGVTKDTITVVLRKPTDYDSLAPLTGYPPFPQVVADTQAYLDMFNASFETYGRKVVLKTFNGQGSAALELQGQGQAGATADGQIP